MVYHTNVLGSWLSYVCCRDLSRFVCPNADLPVQALTAQPILHYNIQKPPGVSVCCIVDLAELAVLAQVEHLISFL